MKRIFLPLCFASFSFHSAYAEIAIAIVGPMKGPNAVFGEQMKRGAAAGVAAVNAAGGINGEFLRLEIADDACDAKQAVTRAQELIAKDVRFVAGHFCSGATMAAAKTYEDAGVLMISPSASLPQVTESTGWNVNRLASRDDGQADIAALRIAAEFPEGQVAILNDGTAITAPIALRLSAALGARAMAVSFKGGDENYKSLVQELQSAGIRVVYFACAAIDAARIAAQMQEAGMSAQLMGGDWLLVDDFKDAAGEGTLVTFAADPINMAVDKEALARFKADGVVPDGATLPTYAAIQAFAAAARARNVNDGPSMAAWLRGGNSFQTILGSLKLDANGDISPPNFVWYKWTEGRYALETNE
jgi:branched-chain amino acid transport system substrate-binding protein